MSRYDETGYPHLNEVLESLGISTVKTDPNDCTYCERGFSKGFNVCPECGTTKPDDCGEE